MSVRLVLAACLAAVLSAAAQATTVMVMSLEGDRAQVLINGVTVRTLRTGQTSPEGVRLVAADRTKAVLEVEGRTLTLGIGQSTVATDFVTTAHINGVPTQALIDTGATAVAVSTDEAQRMGISYAGAPRVRVATAGGPRTGYRVILATVSVGSITLPNVEGLVVEGGRAELSITLIGMTYLNGVDLRRAGDTLTLTRRNF
jgi:aspartyl protease family protein